MKESKRKNRRKICFSQTIPNEKNVKKSSMWLKVTGKNFQYPAREFS